MRFWLRLGTIIVLGMAMGPILAQRNRTPSAPVLLASQLVETLTPASTANSEILREAQRLSIRLLSVRIDGAYTYEFGSRSSPIYCRGECQCLFQRYSAALRDSRLRVMFPNLTLVQRLMIRSIHAGRTLDLRHNVSRSNMNYYDYHVATLILLHNTWFVLDPILIDSTQLETLSAWVSRIGSANEVQVRISDN